jgi:hypothetical protein
MEALSFILQRFSYSLFSGCIINFFIIVNYIVLGKAKILPDKLFEDISFSDSINLLIFIITAVLFSIFIQGICEFVIQKYAELHKERKAFTPRLFNKNKNNPNKDRRTFLAFILWHMCRKISVLEASFFYSKNNDVHEKAIKMLMDATKSTIPYDAVYIGSKLVVKKEKNQDVYRFRDLSFILQLLRISFICIGFISLLSGIIFIIIWIVKNEMQVYLMVFYFASFFVSLIAVLLTTPFATFFSRRYVRDVCRTYKALFMNKTGSE